MQMLGLQNPRKRVYLIASILISLGLIFMCQPFKRSMYPIGVPTVLVGTVGHAVQDHLKR
jgi:hypothetical protein